MKKQIKRFGKTAEFRAGKKLLQAFTFIAAIRRDQIQTQSVELLRLHLEKRTIQFNIDKQAKIQYSLFMSRLQKLLGFGTSFRKLRREIMITYWNIVTQETIDSLNLSKSKPDRDLVGQLIKVQSPSGEIMRNEMIDNFLKKCSKKYEN